ncbi:hypothetical protein CEXT_157591 [Caerostris extrusa]|uniref:Uncharacterized protein n=1 Tax=Caerostris extrusa TaxID=172846 RepID=A0AAV4XK13_CAEEX|nr:hypothetical protein CEXT_157591 [Caerostris extrusa]
MTYIRRLWRCSDTICPLSVSSQMLTIWFAQAEGFHSISENRMHTNGGHWPGTYLRWLMNEIQLEPLPLSTCNGSVKAGDAGQMFGVSSSGLKSEMLS